MQLHARFKIPGNTNILEQVLATCKIFGQLTCFIEPSIAFLEKESDTVERHTRAKKRIRIETINMIEQTIDAQAEISVDKWLNHSWIFVEDSS